jgi:putative ABC transport system permease protein
VSPLASPLLAHELRCILTAFRRRPLVPVVAASILALSIAANVAVFTVISRTLLRPLRYAHAERLLVIASSFIAPDKTEENFPSGSVEIVQWRRRSTQFSAIEAARPVSMTVRGAGDPESIHGANVTIGIFRLFQVRPALGRDFVPEENTVTPRVTILTYGLWRRRFGGDPHVIGRTIVVDGQPLSVVGVMPKTFEIVSLSPRPDLFIPNGFSPANMPVPTARGYTVFGRLRDGVAAKQGEAELRRISAQLATEFPKSQEHWTAAVRTLRDAAFGDRRHALIVLWLMVALVHVLACVNVGSLLSVQIADERGLTALRLVLGAGRAHILRYRLIESLLTSIAGGVAGLILGSLALRLVLLHSTDESLTTPIEGAWLMPLFLIALAIVTGVVVAMIPALLETRTALTNALREQGSRASSSVRGTRMRELFIVVEVALAVPLLLAATATVHRFRELQRTHIGFDADHVLVSQLVLPPRYEKPQRAVYARELLRRVAQVPGVVSVATTTCNFAPDSSVTTMVSSDRFPEPISTNFRRITPPYFATMRVPLIAGRAFNDGDTVDAPPVAIVSASFAKRLFGNLPAVGQHIVRSAGTRATIVGVAADVQDDGPAVESQPTLYSPYLQNNNIYLTLLVRTHGDPLAYREPVRRAVWSLDRDLTPSDESALSQLMDAAVGTDRLQTILLTSFALVALVLAAAGIYGMTAYAVAKRKREIGVRLAFGATPRAIVIDVVQRAVRSVSIGVAAGAVLAFGAQRVASLVVYGAAKFDVRSAAIVMLMLFAATLLAACLPSLRARSVQPSSLLRDQA